MNTMAVAWSFRANNRSDANWMSELRAVVMRPDLERLGRYGPCGVRRRFLDGFVPARTRVIAADGEHEDPTDVYLDAHPFTIEHFERLSVTVDDLGREFRWGVPVKRFSGSPNEHVGNAFEIPGSI